MNKYKAIFSAFVAGIAFSSCQDDGKSFDNKMFIDGDNYKSEVRVATDENMSEMTRTMTVSIARPLDSDLEISVVKSPEMLDTYRQAYYDSSAELLPDEYCDISSVKSVIKSGFVSSSEMEFKFVNLDKGLDFSKTYVLPVSIVSDKISALPRAKTMYFVVTEAALVNSAAYLASNCAWPEWGAFSEVENMEHFTMEALVQGQAFDNDTEAALVNSAAYLASNCAWPEWGAFSEVENMEHFTMEALVQGQAFDNESYIHTIMGIEDRFLLRVGDAGSPTNQLEVAYAAKGDDDQTYRGKITSSNMQLNKNQWYHIAVTFDGGADKTDGAEVAYAAKGDDDQTYRGKITSSNMQLNKNQWYHIAVTFDGGADKTDGADLKVYFDGKLRAEGKCKAESGEKTFAIKSVNFMEAHSDEMDNKPRCFWIKVYFDGKLRAEGKCKAESGEKTFAIKSVNFMEAHSDEMDNKPRCFWIGYSYDSKRSFKGLMAEARVWKRALTEEEINAPNHFYKLYPDSETGQFDADLVAYWKFSEGSGAAVKDWSMYGNDLTADHDLVWYSVSLPEAESEK